MSDQEVRQIRDQTVRDVIRRLTERASDPERIGRRVLMWKFQLVDRHEGRKVIDLASSLGVSQPYASKAIAEAESSIFDLTFDVKAIPTSSEP